MRNMSFALTTKQIRARTKTVTRRLGWQFLKPGDLVRAVVKAQGLKKGEKVEPLGVLRIVGVRVEPLRRMLDDFAYGHEECKREGFYAGFCSKPIFFVPWFCSTHNIDAGFPVTRIEFEYAEPGAREESK